MNNFLEKWKQLKYRILLFLLKFLSNLIESGKYHPCKFFPLFIQTKKTDLLEKNPKVMFYGNIYRKNLIS